jgi:hypothetical protein
MFAYGVLCENPAEARFQKIAVCDVVVGIL